MSEILSFISSNILKTVTKHALSHEFFCC